MKISLSLALMVPLLILGCESLEEKPALHSHLPPRESQREKKVPIIGVPEAVLRFHADQKDWPRNFSELKHWMENSGMDVDFLRSCSELKITDSASEKSAMLEFKIREPNFSSDVKMVLPR